MADNVGSIEYDARINTSKLRGDAKETETIVKSTGDDVEQTGERSFSAFGKWAKVGLLAAGTATAALGIAAFKTGVDYNTLQQTSRAALTTILGSAEAAGGQMDKLNEFVRSSPFSKDIFIKAQQQLLGFGVAAEDVIPALDAIQNAVAAVGGSSADIESITNVLAKLKAEGRLGGEALLQLGGYGIDAASIIGQQMGKSGAEIREMASRPGGIPVDEIWDPLVTGLDQKFGGAADNVKNTWAGTADRIKAAFRDLGSVIAAPFINPNGGGAGVEWGNKFATTLRSIQAGLPPLMEKIKNAMDTIIQAIKPMTDFIINNKQAWEALKNIVIALVLIFSALVIGVVVAVIAAFAALQLIINAVIWTIERVVGVITWLGDVIATAITWIINMGSVVASVFSSIWNSINSAVSNAGSMLTSAGRNLIQGLINGIKGMAWSLVNGVSEVSAGIGRFFSGAGSWLYDTGRALIQGMINGIKGMTGNLGGAIKDVAEGAVNKAKSALGIHSPSRVFAEIGRNISLGMAMGINQAGQAPASAISGVVGGLGADMPAISGSANLDVFDSPKDRVSQNNSVVVNLNPSGMYSRSKADERDIARNLLKSINDELKAKSMPVIGGGAI